MIKTIKEYISVDDFNVHNITRSITWQVNWCTSHMYVWRSPITHHNSPKSRPISLDAVARN